MKKVYLPIIIIIVILVAGAVLFWARGLFTSNGLQMSVNSISQTDSLYNVQVEYPQFNNVGPEFNNRISSLINSQIADFKKQAKDNWDARIATTPASQPVLKNPEAPFDFIASWEPVQLNSKYLSFVVKIYNFVGGAHGVNETYAFNYDVGNKKEITINDFLGNSTQALQNLSEIAKQQVTSQIQSGGVQINSGVEQMINDGTKPTQKNYSNFNFNYNSLTIYFQQYQVAPGYIGPVTITIFKNTLADNSITSSCLK